MYYTLAFTAAVVTLIPAFFHHVKSIDLNSTKERSCVDIKSVPIDMDWLTRPKIWYTPLLSRYDLYHIVADLADRNPEDIRESEVYYDGCIRSWFGRGKFFLNGFKNNTVSYSVTPIRGFEEYYWEGDTKEAKMKGRSYTSLTDNKTFLFIPSCCDGQMTWGVSSTIKRFSEATKKLILDHAESLGFKREYFTALRYESCKEDQENSK